VKRVWNGGANALIFLVFCAVALGLVGCGGGSGSASDRLSAAAYKAKLATISKQADSAHGAVGSGARSAKTVAQVQTLLRHYGAAEARIGVEVSKLKAPQNAEAANAELARGERDDAAEIQALLPKLAKFKTVQQAFAYIQKLGQTKGGQEQDEAISKLRKLGYTTGS
jgi:uncharacterized protein YgbK (DUF1537 family)